MNTVWRILDANLNRASEGLRVVEEIARFVMDDEELTCHAKSCRHSLIVARTHPALSYHDLVGARNAETDVGAASYSDSERLRTNYGDIAIANIKRVQEAGRALEEFGKLIRPEIGHAFKQFRFEAYALEERLAHAMGKWTRSNGNWGLYVITGDNLARGRTLTEVVTLAIAGGAKAIQLREKEMDTGRLVEEGRKIREITREAKVLFFVNDRVDVALAVDADGIHVGQSDMDIKDVRQLVGAKKLIGVSVHDVEQALRAERAGADCIGVGPIYSTNSKADAERPIGLQLLRDIRSAVTIPCIAIGGITEDNIEAVIQAGADATAVISAVVSADDIQGAARGLSERIAQARTSRS